MQAQGRQRLSRSERRELILDAAQHVLREQGYLPLSVGRIARAAGTSTGLIYYYFPSRQALYDELVRRAIEPLARRIEEIDGGDTFRVYAADCAIAYFDQISEHGNVLQTMLSDPSFARCLNARVAAAKNRLWRHFCRLARRELSLTARESLVAVSTLSAIPEELGTLAHRGEVEAELARRLCRRLVMSCLDGLAGH